MRNALLVLALASAACSGTMNTGGIATVTGDADYDSTDKLRFEIEQMSHPMMFAGNKGSTDVSFRITIANKVAVPVTIKRISLQSMGGSTYRLDTQTRKFNQKIAPQAKESFKFWASAIATDLTMETHVPLVVRATVEGLEGETPIRAVFNRRVNDEMTVGVSSVH
ncbi:MAG TPA: hypothetical protein VKL19_00145 [Thermoanaerobaculia bacterium]|nr:hypothetical protein [Thermoanaerobaculia bacterium]